MNTPATPSFPDGDELPRWGPAIAQPLIVTGDAQLQIKNDDGGLRTSSLS